MSDPNAAQPGDPPKPADVPCLGDCDHLVGHVRLVSSGRVLWVREHYCPACKQRQTQEEADQAFAALLDGSGLPARYVGFSYGRVLKQRAGESWPDFNARVAKAERPTVGITPSNARVAALFRDLVSKGIRSVFLTGPVGGGKTTLVAAALCDLMRADVPAVYLPEAALYKRLEEIRRAPFGEKYVDVVAVASRCRVLALDDLGTTEALDKRQRDAIEAIVCARYDGNRPILVTSNLTLAEVGRLHGERVASRLTEMCGRQQVQLIGYDWRTGAEHVGRAAAPVSAAPAPASAARPAAPTPPSWRAPKPDWQRAAAHDRDDD
jgi:hypothetical protein